MTTIKDLPPELLMGIFSYYIRSYGHEKFSRNIPGVCKDWNELSSDSSLWRDVKARDCNYMLNVSRRGLLYYTQSLKYECFAENLSNMNLSAVLENIEDLKALELPYIRNDNAIMALVTEHCPHLERLRFANLQSSSTAPHEWDQFFTVCGPTLKHLELKFYDPEEGQQLVSRISAKCPLLETLTFFSLDDDVPLPIYELRSGCPKLRELEFFSFHFITAETNDPLGCGFKDLKKFKVVRSDFSGLDIGTLLKDSMDLEHLSLSYNKNLVFDNILKIKSDKVKILEIKLRDALKENLKTLEDVVFKWRRTLSVLCLETYDIDISCVLDRLLEDNPNPRLKSLFTWGEVNPHYLKKFIPKCQNLIHLQSDKDYYANREEIEMCFEISP